jgi:hypothetical protein
MPLLPSGRHWCIDDAPLQELLHSTDINGLRLPELLGITWSFQLRRYLRFMWLHPVGADTVPNAPCVMHSASHLEGFTMVDSGHTMASLPGDLDELDRAAVEAFWKSRPCYKIIDELMERVEAAKDKVLLSEAPEERLLAKWFARETASTDRATEAKIEAALMEEGLLPYPDKEPFSF